MMTRTQAPFPCSLEADLHRLSFISIFKHNAAPPGLQLFFIWTFSKKNFVFLFITVDKRQL
jgi:hypothetical protein